VRRLEHYAAQTAEGTAVPILIKGIVSHWPALHTWSLDWLAEEHGHERGGIPSNPTNIGVSSAS
jgi:hypothetical protein